MVRHRLIAAVVIPVILAASGVFADPETDQLREQLRATVLQLRQLQDQQATAPPPAAAVAPAADAGKARLAAVQAQLRVARLAAAKAGELQAQVDKLRAETSALTAARTQQTGQLESIKTAYAQSLESGRTLAAERERLKADLARMTAVAAACQAKNTRLVAFAESVLDAYRKVKVSDVLARGEPFLGLARVRLENLAQDREDAVRGDRCDPRLDATAPSKSGGG